MSPHWREHVPAGPWDAVVVGSGPNGLAAALTLARAGRRVLVLEAVERIGGGLRSAELTEPGFVHDLCASILALGAATPFMASLPDATALDLVTPPLALAHPFDDGRVVTLERDLAATAAGLGADGRAWCRTYGPLIESWPSLTADVLAPVRLPRHPLRLAAFGCQAVRSAAGFVARFATPGARALFAGIAAHGGLSLQAPASAAVGLVLGAAAHVAGWPLRRGGSQRLADALAELCVAQGATFLTNARVRSLSELPSAPLVLLDVSTSQFLELAGSRLQGRYRRALERFEPGVGVFKIDYALDGAIPWRALECSRAATVHLGGSFEEIAASEASVAQGRAPERPFVILVQPSLFDPSRAPAGRHVAWAYGHVPNGWTGDLTPAIEAQIERFAPGFLGAVRARSVWTPARLETDNPNQRGGDISGGAPTLRQLVARPSWSWNPYATPLPGVYLCSSSTPPGGGAHGLCGFYAAQSALRGA